MMTERFPLRVYEFHSDSKWAHCVEVFLSLCGFCEIVRLIWVGSVGYCTGEPLQHFTALTSWHLLHVRPSLSDMRNLRGKLSSTPLAVQITLWSRQTKSSELLVYTSVPKAEYLIQKGTDNGFKTNNRKKILVVNFFSVIHFENILPIIKKRCVKWVLHTCFKTGCLHAFFMALKFDSIFFMTSSHVFEFEVFFWRF